MKHRLTPMPVTAFVVSLLIGILLVGSCGDDGPNKPVSPGAWGAFETGDYATAISGFHAMISADSMIADAYNGLGWTYAFDHQLDSAEYYLGLALDTDSALTDSWAAISAIRLARHDYDSAIAMADHALTLNPDWTFTHLSGIDYQDLHLIKAEACFAMGSSQYANALQSIKALDPDCALDPENSTTWNGHPTYTAALLKRIEELEAVHGADLTL
jgi:tetratricopeptide (TPR) repeat protein